MLEEYRRQVLLAQVRVSDQTKPCLNKMWYNLLVCSEQNIQENWSNDMSEWCRNDLKTYFKNKTNLSLK